LLGFALFEAWTTPPDDLVHGFDAREELSMACRRLEHRDNGKFSSLAAIVGDMFDARTRSLALLVCVTAACAGGGSSASPPGPGAGTGGSGGSAGAGARGGASGGSGGAGGAAGSQPAPAEPPQDAAPAPGTDVAPNDTAAPDAAPDPADAQGGTDGAGDAAGDAPVGALPGAGVPLGTRFSLEPTVTAKWVGTRRTVTMDGASKVFTAGFEAGKFGAGGNGHLIRLPIHPGREYVFEYRLRFDAGYDFSRGGKIPGLAGGNAPSGCDTSTDIGFTARQMWRENGRLIGYIYDMDQGGDCGNAIETGFNFAVGRWYHVKQRIKLNTGSTRNGVLQLWIDDRLVINRSNMGWMIEAPTRFIDKIFLDFFFGGSTADWSPSRNCSLSFSDVYLTRLAD
jgi:hypothetical protein